MRRSVLCCAAALLCFCPMRASAVPKLHDAAAQDNPVTIQAFLDAGAELNERDRETGQTPLMFSVLNGFALSVRYLLAAGADTSIGENDGYTPLHGAGFQGRAEIAQILIDHGLDPNESHADGHWPMHRACWGREKGHADTVKVFLAAGVSPAQPGGNGMTCLDMTRNDATKCATPPRPSRLQPALSRDKRRGAAKDLQ